MPVTSVATNVRRSAVPTQAFLCRLFMDAWLAVIAFYNDNGKPSVIFPEASILYEYLV